MGSLFHFVFFGTLFLLLDFCLFKLSFMLALVLRGKEEWRKRGKEGGEREREKEKERNKERSLVGKEVESECLGRVG